MPKPLKIDCLAWKLTRSDLAVWRVLVRMHGFAPRMVKAAMVARRARVSTRTVWRAIEHLKAAGLLQMQRATRETMAATYQVIRPDCYWLRRLIRQAGGRQTDEGCPIGNLSQTELNIWLALAKAGTKSVVMAGDHISARANISIRTLWRKMVNLEAAELVTVQRRGGNHPSIYKLRRPACECLRKIVQASLTSSGSPPAAPARRRRAKAT